MGKPIRLSSDEEKKLLEMLQTDHQEAEMYVLDPLQRQREEWNDMYYGVVKPRLQDWMSNFPVLIGATFTDAISARIMNTMFAYTPTFTVQPVHDSGWSKIAKNVEQFMQFKVQTEMALYGAMRKTMFETVRLGTGVLLHPWVIEQTTYPVRYIWWDRQVPVNIKNGIVAQYLPIRDFLYPPGYSDLDTLPWWARRMYWTEQMLRVEDRRKYYDVPDNVYKHLEAFPQFTEEGRQRTGEGGVPKRILGWETWMKWDRKEDGKPIRYVVTWHPASSSILRVEEDTYPRWPITLFRYGPRDIGLTGLGVIEMTKPYEDALYALYNLLVDNFKVATMQCFKGKKGTNLSAKTSIYPTKLFMLDDPVNDLVAFPLGQAFALNPGFLNAVWDLGERRAGVSDYALGRESPIVAGRATATGTMALIQEGQRRFDLTIHDCRDAMDSYGLFVLATNHQRLDAATAYMVRGQDGAYIQKWLEFPAIPPQYVLKLISSISHVALNKEVEKQNAAQSFSMLGQYYDKLVQLMMLMMNPQTPDQMRQALQKMAIGASMKASRVLEAYGELSPGQYTNILGGADGEGGNGAGAETGAPGGVQVPSDMGGATGGPESPAGIEASPTTELSLGTGRAS